jgi:acetylornithine deacetylase/succinyl-diaminopimelate desuccinylase-like protein
MTIPTEEAVELLIALIRNECVNDGTPDSGQEYRSVATLASYLGEEGRVFEPHPGRQSVLYRVPGSRRGAPRLMLLGHTDVVPARPEGWSHAPFGGERADGFVWGRGAVDMLDQTATMAVVFKRYLEGERQPLPGDLLFLAVADEEAAGRLGSGWLVENRWEEVACEYLITETGAPFLSGEQGPGLPVTVAEKGPQWRRLVAEGIPGHGSQPYGARSALTPLTRAASRLADDPPTAEITNEWRLLVEAWAPGEPLQSRLLDAERVDAAIDEIAEADPGLARWAHACTHLTVSVNTMWGGVHTNVVPDHAEARIDVRALPGQDEEDVDSYLRSAMGAGDDLVLERLEVTRPNGSAPEGPLWEAIADGLETVTGRRRLIPSLIPVATDARYFRVRGTVAYGVAVFDDRIPFGEFATLFHGNDERVSEESLGLTVAHLAATIERFGVHLGS